MLSPAVKEEFFPNLVLADLGFFTLVIAQLVCIYNDIQGGVEFSPLRNYRKLRKIQDVSHFPMSNNKLMQFFT